MTIDLRSDFLCRPTPEMLKQMVRAAKGKCYFGLREDPIQQHLEKLAATLLGKEDALFFPTCTMCNQAAIHSFCRPGDSFIAEAQSHVVLDEAGAPACLSGATVVPLQSKNNTINSADLENAIKKGDMARSKTALIVLENTHNRSGGTVLKTSQMKEIYEIAKKHQIPIHLDGARLFNAAVYLKIPASELTRFVNTVSVSLNKGLSAPMGAILAGDKVFIEEASRIRQLFGGGWRPTNVLAAAGVIALEKMIDRLADDHENAFEIAKGLQKIPEIKIQLSKVQTNLIIFQTEHKQLNRNEIVDELRKRGILVLHYNNNSIRIAVHREINRNDVKFIVKSFKDIFKYS